MPIPVPLIALLGLGALAAFGLAQGADKPEESTGAPPDKPEGETSPPLATGGGDDTGDEGTPEAPRPRSSSFDAFQTAYAQTPYYSLIAQAEQDQGLPENLLARLLYAESRYDPAAVNVNRNGTKDQGIAQFNEGTSTELAIDPFKPEEAVPAAARYLAHLYDDTGDWFSALCAYNWGIGNVQRFGANSAPPATRTYANAILQDSELQA